MSPPTLPTTGWTYERYLQLDDDERYEIIGGELLVTPAPGTTHQRAVAELNFQIASFVRSRAIGEVFFAPTDVVLSESDVVQPDIVFISNERSAIVMHRAIEGAPDLAVEIVSPSSVRRDRHRKMPLYERSGIREFWIVDPANRTIEVFVLEAGKYDLKSFAAGTGAVSSSVLGGFSVQAATVFGAAHSSEKGRA